MFGYVWYIAGMLLFLTINYFDTSPVWNKMYYTWAKAKDLFFVAAIFAAYKPLRIISSYLLIFLTLRLCWEIIIIPTGMEKRLPIGQNTLWVILVSILVILSIKEQVKGWKQRY